MPNHLPPNYKQNTQRRTKLISVLGGISLLCLSTMVLRPINNPVANFQLAAQVPTQPAQDQKAQAPIQMGTTPTPTTTQGQATNTATKSATTIDATSMVAIPVKLGSQADDAILIKPGEKIQKTIKVRNTSTQTLTIESIAKNYIVAEDGSTPVAVDESVPNRWSLANWMTLVPNQHRLAPGEMAQIQVLIEVPADALPGGHYAMVLHRPASAQAGAAQELLTNSAAAIDQNVGTLFYVVVDGPINEQAFARNFTFPKFSEQGPVAYSFTIENQSDIHINAKTKIEIKNRLLFGKTVGSIVPESFNVFPLMSRIKEGQWDKKWAFGWYEATLTLSYGATGKVNQAKVSFWIIPLKLILGVLAGLFTLLLLIFGVKKRQGVQKKKQQEYIQQLESKVNQLEKTDQPDRPEQPTNEQQ